MTTTLDIGASVKAKNSALAAELRARFRAQGILAVNVLSSPGAGKTSLLERTMTELGSDFPCAAIVGDLATDNDAQRLKRSGAQTVQITTGTVCHLDASMISKACQNLDLNKIKILFLENVGNLVCPAGYDLGEDLRVLLFSVTEGEDKPLKYPHIFKSADIVLISKSDLAEAAGFARHLAMDALEKLCPQALKLELSTRTGAGIMGWYDVLRSQIRGQVDVTGNGLQIANNWKSTRGRISPLCGPPGTTITDHGLGAQ